MMSIVEVDSGEVVQSMQVLAEGCFPVVNVAVSATVMCVRRESFWLQRRHYHRGKLCCKWQLCPWSGLPDHQGRIMSIDVRQGCRERKTVATVDGSVYDRVHIEQWIRTCR